jgi:hypothetical protein
MNKDQYRSYQDLIERLAEAAATDKQIPKEHELAYKYGYVIGLLINLAYNDSHIRAQLVQRLRQLSNNKNI